MKKRKLKGVCFVGEGGGGGRGGEGCVQLGMGVCLLDALSRDLAHPAQNVFGRPFHDGQQGAVSHGAVGPVEDEVVGRVWCADAEIGFLNRVG